MTPTQPGQPMGAQGLTKQNLEQMRENLANSLTALNGLRDQANKGIEHLLVAKGYVDPAEEYPSAQSEITAVAAALYHLICARLLSEEAGLTGLLVSIEQQTASLARVDQALEEASRVVHPVPMNPLNPRRRN